jgi:hypothetical protein
MMRFPRSWKRPPDPLFTLYTTLPEAFYPPHIQEFLNFRYLLVGGMGEVLAWDWEDLARKTDSLEWSLNLPAGPSCEINSMVVERQEGNSRI